MLAFIQQFYAIIMIIILMLRLLIIIMTLLKVKLLTWLSLTVRLSNS